MPTLTKPAVPHTLQPSRVARYVAGKEWGLPVQDQERLTKGIYTFSTPGHGGVVAVIGYAPSLSDAAVQAARECGYVYQVAVWTKGRRNSWFYSFEYSAESWAEFLDRNPQLEVYDVWVGEEDCAKATILGSSELAWFGYSKKMINPEEWRAKWPQTSYRDAHYENEQKFFARLAELEA